MPAVLCGILDQWRIEDCASLVKGASVWFGLTQRKRSDPFTKELTVKGLGDG
jgi:hypothetical protein